MALNGIDHIDRNILKILQIDGRIRLNELADQVALTGPAVRERMRRLEDQGYILGYRAEIDTKKLNLPISAMVRVRTCNHNRLDLQTSRILGSIYMRLSRGSNPDYLQMNPHYLQPACNHRAEPTLCANGSAQHGTPPTALFELLALAARTGFISADLTALVSECPGGWRV